MILPQFFQLVKKFQESQRGKQAYNVISVIVL